MSKKRANPSTNADVLGGDTPENREKDYTPTGEYKDKDGKSSKLSKMHDSELSGKEKDAKGKDDTPKAGKNKDAASSPEEELGKYPMGKDPKSKKKKQNSSPHDTPEDGPLLSSPVPASSPNPSGGTVQTSSHLSGRTQLSELSGDNHELKSKGKDKSPSIGSPGEDLKPLKKRAGRPGGVGATPGSKRSRKATSKRNEALKKVVRKGQAKHQRSFSSYIMRILKDVDSTKRINAQAMMIHDSFANDLSDKIIKAATELVATSQKKQLGSAQIINAVKLVLPPDMARDAQKCIAASVKSYKELTHKWQEQIQDVNKLKEKIKGDSTPK